MFYVLWISALFGCGESGLEFPPMGPPCVDCWDTGSERWNTTSTGYTDTSAQTGSDTTETTSTTGTSTSTSTSTDTTSGTGTATGTGTGTTEPTEICGDIRIETAMWGSENTYDIGSTPGATCVCTGDCAGGPFADYTTYTYSVCWTPASCRFFARDSFGDGWHGGTYRIRTLDGSFDIESAPPAGYKGEYVDLP